ncbi:recombinase family protein [Leifsonia sp. 1010]|uniref:recombinase family protein n=1 Tax=Leifsonia sp. 1010 TaxID=2817769 RepID=UPI002855B6B2|nr:recombinase family protein [Leifsonia sp. 1010]MDR6613601.1 DNA invertase Pin-like site-specific DNA recombinase [Leifsonia sp. 1010]
MKQANAAAIYARISSDQSGEGLGVQRQLEDCRRLAAERDWVVAGEYVDNDISAYSGRTRPNYERMLIDIEAGRIDAVLVYHLDRLTRRPAELEHFIDVCTDARVDVTTVTGDIGLGNDNGLMIARITSAMAAAESGRKSARIKRKMLQNAEMGKPSGGGQRPFGYEHDRVTVRESEAEVIRALADRYIKGESMIALAHWLNDQNVPTSGGVASWHVQTVRRILVSGRIAGLRDHHGEPIAEGKWPAIISVEQREQLLTVLRARGGTQQARTNRYLLSGMLRCGLCGAKLHTTITRSIRRYTCRRSPGDNACGRLSINAIHVEEWAAAAVVLHLDARGMTSMLASRASADYRHSPYLAEVLRAQQILTELAEMLGAGELSRTEYAAARKVAEARHMGAVRELDRATGTNAMHGLDPKREALTRSWERLDLQRQRSIVRTLLDFAIVYPRPRGQRKLDPTRIEARWVV